MAQVESKSLGKRRPSPELLKLFLGKFQNHLSSIAVILEILLLDWFTMIPEFLLLLKSITKSFSWSSFSTICNLVQISSWGKKNLESHRSRSSNWNNCHYVVSYDIVSLQVKSSSSSSCSLSSSSTHEVLRRRDETACGRAAFQFFSLPTHVDWWWSWWISSTSPDFVEVSLNLTQNWMHVCPNLSVI